MNILYLFLPGILILGLITSYTDIKYGKIRNKTIIFALVYALIMQVLAIFIMKVNSTYIVQTIANIITALLVGYLMWDIGLWTAGDGKLFLAYAAMIPLFIYNPASQIHFFSSMNILINTFVPLFIFFFFNLIFRTSAGHKMLSIKKALDIRRIVILMLTIFVFFWFMGLLTNFVSIRLNLFLYMLLLFLLLYLMETILPKKSYWVIAFLALLRFLFDDSIYNIIFLRDFMFVTISFVLLRYFVLELGFSKFTTSVPINRLEPGMVPAEIIYKEQERYQRKKILFFSFLSYIKARDDNALFDIKSEGLLKKDIDKIKDLAKRNTELKTFQIQQTIPFAPFLFIGAVLAIAASGNIFIFLRFIFFN